MTMCTSTTTTTVLLLLFLIALFSSHTHAKNDIAAIITIPRPTLKPSSDITPAEHAILQTISKLPNNQKTNEDNPHGLFQTLQTRIKTIQSEITSLETHVTKVIPHTFDPRKFTGLTMMLNRLRNDSRALVGHTRKEGRKLERRDRSKDGAKDTIKVHETTLDLVGIGGYNLQKMKEVERHLDEMKSLMVDEFDHLTTAMQILIENEQNLTDTTGDDDDDEEDDTEEEITTEEMERSIRWHHLVTKVESDAKESLSASIQTSWKSKIEQDEGRYEKKAKELEGNLQRQLDGIEKVDACMEVLDTGELVHSSLRVEGERMYDHLSTVGSVVYGSEWTSDTFEPFDMRKGKKRHKSVDWTLGYLFGSIIPEDWEKFLPAEWDEYNISFFQDYTSYSNLQKQIRSIVPNYVWHTLPTAIIGSSSSATTTSTGVVGSIPPPPEMVLNPNTNLGSCWPISHRPHGVDDGKITIRLGYPVRLEGITVDHYSGTGSQVDKSSAPRSFVVEGYLPCPVKVADGEGEEQDSGKECRAIGFDATHPIKLGSFEYKIVPRPVVNEEDDGGGDVETWPTRSVQKFSIGSSFSPKAVVYSSSSKSSTIIIAKDGMGDDYYSDDQLEKDGGGFGTDTPMPGSCSISSCAPPDNDNDDDDYDDGANSNDGDHDDDDDDDDDNDEVVLTKLMDEQYPAVEAVTIRIIDNWGNPDITCLYRIQLHGRGIN